jgi:hypothetical protein
MAKALQRAEKELLNRTVMRRGDFEFGTVTDLVLVEGDVWAYVEWDSGDAEDMTVEEAKKLLRSSDDDEDEGSNGDDGFEEEDELLGGFFGAASKKRKKKASAPRKRKAPTKKCVVTELNGFSEVRGVDTPLSPLYPFSGVRTSIPLSSLSLATETEPPSLPTTLATLQRVRYFHVTGFHVLASH